MKCVLMKYIIMSHCMESWAWCGYLQAQVEYMQLHEHVGQHVVHVLDPLFPGKTLAMSLSIPLWSGGGLNLSLAFPISRDAGTTLSRNMSTTRLLFHTCICIHMYTSHTHTCQLDYFPHRFVKTKTQTISKP